jgi:hypothetical protein
MKVRNQPQNAPILMNRSLSRGGKWKWQWRRKQEYHHQQPPYHHQVAFGSKFHRRSSRCLSRRRMTISINVMILAVTIFVNLNILWNTNVVLSFFPQNLGTKERLGIGESTQSFFICRSSHHVNTDLTTTTIQATSSVFQWCTSSWVYR